VAPDTSLIHDHHGEGTAPVSVALNSLVIRAKEPVIIDTGISENREQYLADVFSLVDPEDIRWVFISHDDVDHVGNLEPLLEAAVNATVVTTWFMIERMGSTMPVPPQRWRWVRDGESFDVGDRVLHAVRPPIFDSPTTRGLFDPTTGFYWASDSFATPMLAPTNTVDGYDRDFWAQGIATFAQASARGRRSSTTRSTSRRSTACRRSASPASPAAIRPSSTRRTCRPCST